MLRFPEDTRDQIERDWWPVIRIGYPNYGPFWETFIGRKIQPGPLTPYGLSFSKPHLRQKEVLEAYESLVMAHYSQFCEFAGAHHLLSAAEAANNDVGGTSQLFTFQEAFNGFYDHLGTGRNMLCRMWNKLSEIQVALGSAANAGKPGEALEDRFRRMGESHLADELEQIVKEVVPLRDNHVHNIGSSFVPIGGRFFLRLPIEVEPKPPWKQPPPLRAIGACKRMRSDLERVERLFDEASKVLTAELLSVFSAGGVSVDY